MSVVFVAEDDDDGGDDGGRTASERRRQEATTTALVDVDVSPLPRRKKWPEDSFRRDGDDGDRYCRPSVVLRRQLYGAYQRWTYSYMNDILRKGYRQQQRRRKRRGRPSSGSVGDDTTDDNEEHDHLVQDDLFAVPETMESEHLLEKFRYVVGNLKYCVCVNVRIRPV